MIMPSIRPTAHWLVLALLLLAPAIHLAGGPQAAPPRDHATTKPASKETATVKLQFIEIVTPEVEATCQMLADMHGVTFADPDPMLGNARVVALADGARLSVRAPMHAQEKAVVRVYRHVDDLEAAVAKAQAAGCQIAIAAMEIPGQGRIAIYFQGGIEHGLWQP